MSNTPKLDQALNVERAWILAHVLAPDCKETADKISSQLLTAATCYKDLDEALMACHESIGTIDNSRPDEEVQLELGFIKRRLNEICATWERRKKALGSLGRLGNIGRAAAAYCPPPAMAAYASREVDELDKVRGLCSMARDKARNGDDPQAVYSWVLEELGPLGDEVPGAKEMLNLLFEDLFSG